MIERQAKMVVKVARTVGEIVQGKESAHSLHLLDLEQLRAELGRRNQAAVSSATDLRGSVDEILRTMETLDRAAACLFLAAHDFDQLAPDETSCQMMRVIQKAATSLLHGYTRLANGSPAAELDADAAIGSRKVLGRYRELPKAESRGASSHALRREQALSGRDFRLYGLHGHLSDTAHELAAAGTILKRWSGRLSADPNPGVLGGGMARAQPPTPSSIAADAASPRSAFGGSGQPGQPGPA